MTRQEIRLASLIAALSLLDLAVWLCAIPLVPRWERSIGLSHLQSGVVLASYSVAVLMLSIPAGHLGDRIGPRRLTIAAAFLFAITTPLFAFATSFAELVALRFVNGVFSAVSWTAGLAWLVASVPDDRRGRAMTLVNAAASPASVVGPLIGGPAVHYLGLKPTMFALGGAILTLASWALLERSKPHVRADAHPSALSGLRACIRVPGIRHAYLGIGFASVAYGVQQLLATLHLADVGISPAGIGWVFSSGAAVSVGIAYLMTRDRVPADRRLVGRTGVATITTLMVFFSLNVATGPFIAGAVVMAAAGTALWVSFYPLCSEAADRAGIGQGLALGGLNTIWAACSIVAPTAAGFMAEHGQATACYLVVAGLGVVVVVGLRPALRSAA